MVLYPRFRVLRRHSANPYAAVSAGCWYVAPLLSFPCTEVPALLSCTFMVNRLAVLPVPR